MKKLTNREKILVALFLVFLVAYGYYKFIYVSQANKIASLETELSIQEEKGRKITEAVQIQEDSNKKIEEYNFAINDISKEYLPIMTQENFLKLLNEIITSLDIEMASIPLPEYALENVTIEQYAETLENGGSTLEGLVESYENGNKPANSESGMETNTGSSTESSDTSEESDSSTTESTGETIQEENPLLTIKKISIPFNFEGSYDNFRDAVKYFNNFRRNIIISSISINALEGDKYSINMTLDFYFVPNVEGEKSEFIKWETTEGAGMYNPFVPGGSIVSNSKLTSSNIQDFSINLSPETSDKPTVIVGKYGDASRKTYVYDNKNETANVEIELTEKDGKYYYKYSTDTEKYPYEEEITEMSFMPRGESIFIRIYSNPRVSNEDMSGINLTVKNLTSKRVDVEVSGDDPSRPRLVNLYKEGAVQLK